VRPAIDPNLFRETTAMPCEELPSLDPELLLMELQADQGMDPSHGRVASHDRLRTRPRGSGEKNVLTPESFTGDEIDTITLSTRDYYCASEPFENQPAAAFYIGFLIDPSRLATTCRVNVGILSKVRLIIGHEMSDATTAITRILAGEICNGIAISAASLVRRRPTGQ
jgi:hypothetical protein